MSAFDPLRTPVWRKRIAASQPQVVAERLSGEGNALASTSRRGDRRFWLNPSLKFVGSVTGACRRRRKNIALCTTDTDGCRSRISDCLTILDGN